MEGRAAASPHSVLETRQRTPTPNPQLLPHPARISSLRTRQQNPLPLHLQSLRGCLELRPAAVRRLPACLEARHQLQRAVVQLLAALPLPQQVHHQQQPPPVKGSLYLEVNNSRNPRAQVMLRTYSERSLPLQQPLRLHQQLPQMPSLWEEQLRKLNLLAIYLDQWVNRTPRSSRICSINLQLLVG